MKIHFYVYDSTATRGKGGAHVTLYQISFDSAMRLSVKYEILRLSLYVTLKSAGGIGQEGMILLSLLLSVTDIKCTVMWVYAK